LEFAGLAENFLNTLLEFLLLDADIRRCRFDLLHGLEGINIVDKNLFNFRITTEDFYHGPESTDERLSFCREVGQLFRIAHELERTLVYSLRRNPGQRVTFYETGPESFGRIGVAAGERGTLDFTAADGPRGRRTIEAQVESFGLPRAAVDVTTYSAPGPIKPGKPRKLRLRRRGSKLLVSWRQARYAKSYLVATKLKDGRRIGIVTKRTRAKLANVPGIDSGQVRVAGLTADNTHGKVAKAQLKAKPKRRRGGR
jgi:hypothetical protein